VHRLTDSGIQLVRAGRRLLRGWGFERSGGR
jgi:hypothetical protein